MTPPPLVSCRPVANEAAGRQEDEFQKAQDETIQPATAKKRVLLVDDDAEIIEAIRYALETKGYQIFVARDGNQGLAMAESEDPAEALWAAVRQLPDKQRDAVLLVYGEGLSHAAAAEAMAISETTVSWRIHEAKKRLKTLMRSAGEV